MSKVHSPKGLRISDEVHKALRIRAAETGESMGDIAERALRRELGLMETLTYRTALERLSRDGYDVVRTNAYDQDITDHLNELEDDGPEVNWSKAEDGTVTLVEIGKDGYEVGGWLAKVLKAT